MKSFFDQLQAFKNEVLENQGLYLNILGFMLF